MKSQRRSRERYTGKYCFQSGGIVNEALLLCYFSSNPTFQIHVACSTQTGTHFHVKLTNPDRQSLILPSQTWTCHATHNYRQDTCKNMNMYASVVSTYHEGSFNDRGQETVTTQVLKAFVLQNALRKLVEQRKTANCGWNECFCFMMKRGLHLLLVGTNCR